MVIFRYVQISQGRWGDASGLKLSDVLAEQLLRDSAFVRQYPTTAPNYHPNFYLGTVTDTERVPVLPKGHERYVINDDGTLGPREANWDSGD